MGCTLILGFGSLRPGSRDADQSGHPHGVLGVGTQATDWCASPPGGFGPVCLDHRASHLGVHQPVLQVCAGAAYPAFTVQGLMGWGCKRPRLLPRILLIAAECLYFLFLFEKFFLFKPPWSKQAPGCSHSPAWLSPKNPAADPAPGLGLQPPWSPLLVPGTLLSLSTLLTIRSFNVLYLWSPIFIYAGIPLAVCSVPQIS